MPQSTSTRSARTVYISEPLWDEIQRDWFEQNLSSRRVGKSDHLELILRRGLQSLRRGRTSAADSIPPSATTEPVGEEPPPSSVDPTPPADAAAALNSTARKATGTRAPRADGRSNMQARLQRIAAAPGKPIPLPGADSAG